MAPERLTRVLLVEDDPDIRTIAVLAMEALGGLTVRVCAAPDEAPAAAIEFAPEMILLDVMMPGCDGPSLLARLRRLPATAQTPVVFVTARVQPQEIERYLRLRPLGVIPKPFEPTTLASTLQQLWERRDQPTAVS
jgi:CheY-like chemotaxis protein